ncbi:unnamed protein product [Paramecium octaurelia]|uniref:HSF-type DNA-binding domain-containing protein n=1 Tax=Paramecium octaurelia TaxID=43137 RepID=A0A8S1VL05_PAROT|nr:unnamed protein product [Paramecium octaurelia]
MQEKQKPKLFLEKLFDLLESGEAYNIIQWTVDKDAIKIINRSQLIRDILPNIFKQTSYKSFTKQMNLYNFKSTKDENGFTVFINPHFTQSSLNLTQIMAEKRTIKKSKKEDTKKRSELQQEHELLKQKLMALFKYQVTLQNEIKTQLEIHKHLQMRVALIKKCIYSRKENGLKRRRKVYNFLNSFFTNLKSSVICQKFLILNHDLICQCDDNDEEQCRDFQTSRSLYQTPYLTPRNLTIFQQNSIRQLQDLFYDEDNKPKSFLQLTPEQQKQFIETIWDD